MNTNTESRIINHWSLFAFAQEFGADIAVGTCKSSTGEAFPASTFTKNGKRTFVGFGGSLEGGLTFDEIVAQANNLQVVQLETDKETIERRSKRAKETGEDVQMETYKLCKKGESTWQGGNLFAALGK